MLVSSFDHVHIYAASPEDSIAFWERALGAERVGVIGGMQGPAKHLLVLGGQYLVISGFPEGLEAAASHPEVCDGAVRNGYGVAHVGVNVTDFERAARGLREAGAVLHGEPEKSGPIRYIYATGPDGVVIEVTQYVLPARLKPAAAVLDLFNVGVHRARKGLAKLLLRAL